MIPLIKKSSTEESNNLSTRGPITGCIGIFLFDASVLQQNSFDKVDAGPSLLRTKRLFLLSISIIKHKFLVKSKEEDRSDHASTSSDSGDQQQVASAAVEIPSKESDNLSDDPPTLVDKEDTETADQNPIVGNNSTADEDADKEKT